MQGREITHARGEKLRKKAGRQARGEKSHMT